MLQRKVKIGEGNDDTKLIIGGDKPDVKDKLAKAREALAKLDNTIDRAESRSEQRGCCGCGC